MKVYIAAPLFSAGEKAFNLRTDEIIRSCGHDTYLPQRDGGVIAELPDTVNGVGKYEYVFGLDCRNLSETDIFLYVFDGRVPDEGASFALGYCYALGKRCIGYKTDCRTSFDGLDNVMISCAPERVLRSEDELRDFFKELKKHESTHS